MRKDYGLNFLKIEGFTFLEMIICIGIFVLVATASSTLFNHALVAYGFTTSRSAAVREAVLAMQWIKRDIRPNAAGIVLNIQTGTPDMITLQTQDGLSQINYYVLNFNSIMRRMQTPFFYDDALLAQNVTLLSFGYFGADNLPVGIPNDAKTVQIIITTSVNGREFRLYGVAER